MCRITTLTKIAIAQTNKSLRGMRLIFTIFSFLFFGLLMAQESSIDVQAKLKVENAEGLINIEGYAENSNQVNQSKLEYLLLSLKIGKTGNVSKNSQSGRFSLSSKESKKLSTLKINIQPDEEIKLFLYIRKEKQLISKDTLVISNKKKRVLIKPRQKTLK